MHRNRVRPTGLSSRTGGYGRNEAANTLGAKRLNDVTPHESHLQSDGSVFPPVTPDPPPPPGEPEIVVPDIVPVSTPDGPDRSVETREEPGVTGAPGEPGEPDVPETPETD